jgi:bifunctional ADP-heptose synthase (sugar kinase/adenylyltransferase)
MNNLAKFLITALLIVAGALAFNSYKNGGFDNIKSEAPAPEVDVEDAEGI